jgi:hypothetical protein
MAGAGLLLAVSAAPVAGFAMLEPLPGLNPFGAVVAQATTSSPATSPSPPGYGDFGGAGNPYSPDASPTGIHSGAGAFSDQQPLSSY